MMMMQRILKQIASIGLAEGLGRLFTFGFSALVARTAGIDVLGYLSLALALIAYVTIAGDSGLNQDSTRRLIRGDDPKNVVKESVQIQFIVSSCAFVLVVIFAVIAYGDPVWKYVVFLLPVPIAASLSTPYLLDYVRRIRPLVASRLMQTVSIGVAGMVFIWLGVRGEGIAFAYGIGYWCSAVFVIRISRAPYRSVFGRIDRSRLNLRLESLRRLGLTGLLLHLYVSLPLLVAGFAGSEVLAEMGLISRIWFLASAPAAMAGTVLLPVMSSVDGRTKVWNLVAIGFGLGAFGTVLIGAVSSPLIVLLFGADASVASAGLAVFCLALPAYGALAVGSAYLVAIHRERAVSVAYTIAIVAFVTTAGIANWAGVPVPLAFSWVVSSFLLAFVLCLVVLRDKRRISEWTSFARGGSSDEGAVIRRCD